MPRRPTPANNPASPIDPALTSSQLQLLWSQLMTGADSRRWAAHQAGQEHPHRRPPQHRAPPANWLVHRFLQATGQISRYEIAASGDRRFSVGDRVIARTPTATSTHPDNPTPTSGMARSAPSSCPDTGDQPVARHNHGRVRRHRHHRPAPQLLRRTPHRRQAPATRHRPRPRLRRHLLRRPRRHPSPLHQPDRPHRHPRRGLRRHHTRPDRQLPRPHPPPRPSRRRSPPRRPLAPRRGRRHPKAARSTGELTAWELREAGSDAARCGATSRPSDSEFIEGPDADSGPTCARAGWWMRPPGLTTCSSRAIGRGAAPCRRPGREAHYPWTRVLAGAVPRLRDSMTSAELPLSSRLRNPMPRRRHPDHCRRRCGEIAAAAAIQLQIVA